MIKEFDSAVYYKIVKNAINNLEKTACKECGWIHFTKSEFNHLSMCYEIQAELFPFKLFYGKKIASCHMSGPLVGFRGFVWSSVRAEQLMKKPTCILCSSQATSVHHIIPFRLWRKQWQENLVSVCSKCHRPIELDINIIPLNVIKKLAIKILGYIGKENHEEFFRQMWNVA